MTSPSRLLVVLMSLTVACETDQGIERGGGENLAPVARVDNPFTNEVLRTRYVPYGLVGHALGSADGEPYTNSREAFEQSYAAGFRVFEVDVVMLADKSVWTVHNWFEDRYGLADRFDHLTARDLESARLDGKFEPMRIDALIERVAELGDVWVILDTKAPPRELSRAERMAIHVETMRSVVAAAASNPAALDRFVPHVGTEDGYEQIHALYPFPHYMFAIYRSDAFEHPNWDDERVLRFVTERGIGAVMMKWDTRYSPAFAERLQAAQVAVYVHSLNERDRIDAFRARGIGVYSDGFMYDR